MARALPVEILSEITKLYQDSAMISLIAVDILATGDVLRLANYPQDIDFQGNTFFAFAFEIPGVPSDTKGTALTVPLRISNTRWSIQAYIQQWNGCTGYPVTLYLVNSNFLGSDYDTLTWKFSIQKTEFDEKWVTFTLGAPNLLKRQFPPDEFIADFCPFDYMSEECYGANQFDPQKTNPCDHDLKSCRARGNSHRFGGFMGLSLIGMRLV